METLQIRRQNAKINNHPLRNTSQWEAYQKAEQQFLKADKALSNCETEIDDRQRELSQLNAPVNDVGKTKIDLLSMFRNKQKRKEQINSEIEKLLSKVPALQDAKLSALQQLEKAKNDVLAVAKRLHSDIASSMQQHLDSLKEDMDEALALKQAAPGFEIPYHQPITHLVDRIQARIDNLKKF